MSGRDEMVPRQGQPEVMPHEDRPFEANYNQGHEIDMGVAPEQRQTGESYYDKRMQRKNKDVLR